MRLLYSLAAVTTLLAASCSSVPRGGSFLAPPKSYAFLPDKTMEAADAAGLSNMPYWHSKVEEAISAELGKKGYTLASNVRAGELVVAIHVITQRGNKTSFLDNYFGYTLSAKEQAEQPELITFLQTPGAKNRAILIIDVIDPVKREVVWRDWTQNPIKRQINAKVQEQRIVAAVHKILSGFPPKE